MYIEISDKELTRDEDEDDQNDQVNSGGSDKSLEGNDDEEGDDGGGKNKVYNTISARIEQDMEHDDFN